MSKLVILILGLRGLIAHMMKTACSTRFVSRSTPWWSVTRLTPKTEQFRQEPWSKLVRLCVRLPPWPLTFFVSLAAGWRTVELLQKLCGECNVVHQRSSSSDSYIRSYQWFSTCTNSVSSDKLTLVYTCAVGQPSTPVNSRCVLCQAAPWLGVSLALGGKHHMVSLCFVMHDALGFGCLRCSGINGMSIWPVWVCDGVFACLYIVYCRSLYVCFEGLLCQRKPWFYSVLEALVKHTQLCEVSLNWTRF